MLVQPTFTEADLAKAVRGVVNGLLDNQNIRPGAGINVTKTDLNSALARHAVYYQDLTSNALLTNQVMYYGWSFVLGTGGADTETKQITLPNGGYDNDRYDVQAFTIGTKIGADPTTPTDVASLTNNYYMEQIGTAAKSATAFTVKGIDSDGAAMANTNRFLFGWRTIGTKA